MDTERQVPDHTDNSVSGGAFHGPVVQAGSVTGGVHTHYAQPAHSSLPPVSEWPQLGTADPIALGVRRTRCLPGETPLPPYVERDCDRSLGARVREAVAAGGLVVVTGAPLSGKTRTAWAALFSNLPGATRIFAPPSGTDLHDLPALLRGRGDQDCVLWLDGLEGHLGERGLTPTVLAELVRLRVPVVATMDDEAYDARRFGVEARAGVLSGVEPVELERKWTDGERGRLTELREDPRLGDAYVHPDIFSDVHTVPEYLALGPELMEEWRRARRPSAHPRGYLLVRVAIDLARCGASEVGFSGELLRRGQDLYPKELAAAAAEPFKEGLGWATDLRYGLTGLLTHDRRTRRWKAFRSLWVDVEARPDSPPVPLGMWKFAVDAMPLTRLSTARRAVAAKAEGVLGPQAEGDPDFMFMLGDICAAGLQHERAESWYRKAADTGHAKAAAATGDRLISRGAEVEAIPYLEQAAEAGIAEAQYRLARVLTGRAHGWLARSAKAGHPAAARMLPALREADFSPYTVKE
ncbi:tetratricopeptide repeat protein [Streptomyces sp. NPDC002533]